jgi:hypothetical protein
LQILKLGINNNKYVMLDNIELDQHIRMAILNLCVVLYDCGITEIHVGGIMRILGVSDDTAQAHDQERIVLDENFVKYVDEITELRPDDQPLH